MNINEIVQKFSKNPKYLENGAGLLSKMWNCSKDDIYKAKEMYRASYALKEMGNKQIKQLSSKVGIVSQQTNFETGERSVNINSNNPLSPKEIEEMVGVDGITTYVARVWDKLNTNGQWTYSVDIRYTVKDFSTKELETKLAEIFPKDIEPVILPIVQSNQMNALFIYISDDHCGNILKDSLFDNEYNQSIYTERLLEIVDEVVSLERTFESVYVVNLGDELDGWNGKTTRYDHDLGSASNKEQFDIFLNARKLFYDKLFNSGVSETYTIYNVNNSNHTGLGLSYIANKALEMYVSARYPEVTITNQSKFIDGVCYGNHFIAFTHGKDEKFMKAPLPLNLDPKSDLWLYDWYTKKLDNIGEYWISTIKGDIHKYNVNIGKSGRYVNVPSISSGSNWIEHNFGDSTPGALLEIVNATSKNIQSIPIWF